MDQIKLSIAGGVRPRQLDLIERDAQLAGMVNFCGYDPPPEKYAIEKFVFLI